MDVTSWQNLLEEHHALLNKHRETLTLMGQCTENGTSGAQLLQSCLEQTESIAQSFKMSAYKFMEELQLRNQAQPTPANAAHSPTVNGGVNGPTPAEQVLLQSSTARRTVIRTKRKAPGDDPTPAHVAAPTKEAPRKRARAATSSRSGTATPHTREARSNSSSQPPRPTIEDGDDDDSFLRAVQAKLTEKEEKVWKGMVKKRKRTSENSDTILDQATRKPTTSSIPRKKTRQTLIQIEGDVLLEHPSTPQQEKQTHKRPSPATEYMESILRRADTKRQRMTRSTGRLVG